MNNENINETLKEILEVLYDIHKKLKDIDFYTEERGRINTKKIESGIAHTNHLLNLIYEEHEGITYTHEELEKIKDVRSELKELKKARDELRKLKENPE